MCQKSVPNGCTLVHTYVTLFYFYMKILLKNTTRPVGGASLGRGGGFTDQGVTWGIANDLFLEIPTAGNAPLPEEHIVLLFLSIFFCCKKSHKISHVAHL